MLAKAVSFTFTTPPPKVVSQYPDSTPQPLQPLIFIAFDQRIDPAAVLETIRVTAGSQVASVRLAAQAEIEADARVKQLSKNTLEGRWLALHLLEPLPPETGVSVTIGPGTPSAEGPLLTEAAQSFGFSTYAPLRIVEVTLLLG